MTGTTTGDLMHHSIARMLGLDIIDGAWAVGDALTLEDIQSRFDVSRTVAREAGRQLESLGMVSTRRRVGLVALPISCWDTLDSSLIDWRLHSSQRGQQLYSLTQLRAAIEPSAAEGAAAFASVDVRARLLALSHEMRRLGEAGELDEFMERDVEYHRLILTNCGNELYGRLADQVSAVLMGRVEVGLMPQRPKPEALALHESVARAISEGDGGLAQVSMSGLLAEVRGTLAQIRNLDAPTN